MRAAENARMMRTSKKFTFCSHNQALKSVDTTPLHPPIPAETLVSNVRIPQYARSAARAAVVDGGRDVRVGAGLWTPSTRPKQSGGNT